MNIYNSHMDATNKIINRPEYVNYHRLYNAGIFAILILMLIIPIVSIVYAIHTYNIRQSSRTQNIERKNTENRNQFVKENNLPTNINTKCLEYVRWVYSNRHIDPVYKKRNIRTLLDAYNYVVCYNNSDQADPTDKSMICGHGDKAVIC